MQKAEIEELVRKIIEEHNVNFTRSKFQEELDEIDYQIDMVRKYHATLVSAVEAVIPDEEPHDSVLAEMRKWLRIARAAQIGELRNRRQSFESYSDDMLESMVVDGDMLDSPSDGVSLMMQREMRTDEAPEIYSEGIATESVEISQTNTFQKIFDKVGSGIVFGFIVVIFESVRQYWVK